MVIVACGATEVVAALEGNATYLFRRVFLRILIDYWLSLGYHEFMVLP